MQLIAVYLHVHNCLIEYRLALLAIFLMGHAPAPASETLTGGHICTIGDCSTPQKSLERTQWSRVLTMPHFLNYTVVEDRAACLTEEEHEKNRDGQEDGAMVKDAMLLYDL